MFTSAQPLVLSPSERTELATMAHSRTLHAALVQRAQLILALADGTAYAALRTRFAVSDPTIARWRQRFVTQRVAGLRDRPRDGRGDRLAPAVEAKILALTQQPPPKPYTHWTTRRLAARLRLSHMTVHRVWQRAGLKPHRLERYVASPDPDFERKAADIIGLYLNPPTHARRAAHQCRVRALPRPRRGDPGEAAGDPPHLRQPLGPQNAGRAGLAGSASARHHPLHADLRLVAQPNRALVCEDRARSPCARDLHLRRGPAAQAPAVHPGAQHGLPAICLDVPQREASHPC